VINELVGKGILILIKKLVQEIKYFVNFLSQFDLNENKSFTEFNLINVFLMKFYLAIVVSFIDGIISVYKFSKVCY
jgi:hypothetical protein